MTATVSTLTAGVTITQPNSSFGTIPAGGFASGAPPISIQVDSSVACGTTIVFNVQIKSDQGTFTDTCSLTIPTPCTACAGGPVLSVQSCNHKDSCALGGPGNGNDQVEPGESVTLDAVLLNTGLGQATNVTATLTSPTPGVTITQGTSSFGTISASAFKVGTPPFAYKVDLTVACGTKLAFNFAIQSDQGTASGKCSVDIPSPCTSCTAGPSIAVGGCNHKDACAIGGPGNGNDQVDPGESVTLDVTALNTGQSQATNVTATVTSPTPGITITQGSSTFGTIPAGGFKVGTPSIAYTVALSVPCNTLIVLDVAFKSDQGDFAANCSVTIPVGCTKCTNAPALAVGGCLPADTCASGGPGDKNGSVDPGESVKMTLTLTNNGGGAATNTSATVSTATPGVTITQASTTFGSVPASGLATGAATIDYTVSAAAACGTDIVFSIAVTYDQGTAALSCDTVVPSPCIPCGGGSCAVSSLLPLARLRAVKAAAPAVTFDWLGQLGSSVYHLNAVTAKTDLVAPRPKRTPAGVGQMRCDATPPMITCSDGTAITDAATLLLYQSLAACGSSGDTEGP